MDTQTIVLIVVVAVIVLAVAAWLATRSRKRAQLKETFGSEYDRTVERRDDKREAEAELLERQRKREQIDVRPLSDGDRTRFLADWDRVEARFIEDPEGAARDGDRIVADVMRERGYPVDGRDHTDVLSVDHPDMVERYRRAIRTASEPRSASTEDLRQAMLDLRTTFEQLVHDGRGHGDRPRRTDDRNDDRRYDEETRDGTR